MSKSEDTVQKALRTVLLSLLPADGSPVLNRLMRVMMARRLERPIDEDTYFAARDALLAEGRVGRLRGQGGQVFLVTPTPEPRADTGSPPTTLWTERDLMAPLQAFLDGPFTKGLDLPEGGQVIIQDTSASGTKTGRWARPDFILVSAMRFRLLPGCQIDLHSFELKAENGGGVLAIHEALAQTRFTHFGHLVWHVPDGSRAEAMLGDVVAHCEEHGIGFIRMHDPRRAATDGCEILVDPRRKPTLNVVVDGFLESRLSGTQKRVLQRFVGAASS